MAKEIKTDARDPIVQIAVFAGGIGGAVLATIGQSIIGPFMGFESQPTWLVVCAGFAVGGLAGLATLRRIRSSE